MDLRIFKASGHILENWESSPGPAQAAPSSSPPRRLWRNTTAVQLAPAAGCHGSPTTSTPAISIASRPAILHRWGYVGDMVGWSHNVPQVTFSFLVSHFYDLCYCKYVFVAILLQRWWSSNINCACSNFRPKPGPLNRTTPPWSCWMPSACRCLSAVFMCTEQYS